LHKPRCHRSTFSLSCLLIGGLLLTPLEPVAEQYNSEAANPQQPRVASATNLDWVEQRNMTEEQRATIPPYCCGAYLEPARDYPDADLDPQQAPLRINALSTEAKTDVIAVLKGDVHISQGYRQVRSDQAVINQDSRQITLDGNVHFREPNMLLIGDSANLNLDSRQVRIDNATYVLHQTGIRGTAANLLRNTDGAILIEDATYSSCEPTDETWRLQTSEIKIDQASGFATVRNARLQLKDIPIVYLPYVKFPITDRRSSGLLFPAISVDGENGVDFAQPIYWNLAPNYDATITPRYIQKRGLGIETEFRHLNSWSTTNMTSGFLGNDKGGDSDSPVDPMGDRPDYQGEDRYWLGLQHQGGLGRPWSTFLDINHVSDRDYFDDIGQLKQNQRSRTHLRRQASLGYHTAHWDFDIQTLDFQSITAGLSDQYRVMPKLSIMGNYQLAGGLRLNLNQQYAQFDHHDQKLVTGSRSRLGYNLSWDQQWHWGYIRPAVGYKHLSYSLEKPEGGEQIAAPSINVPTYSLDSGIFFQRDHPWLSTLRQTFEPRLYYLKTAYRDQASMPDFDTREIVTNYDQLFRDNRFQGGDRVADEHRVTIGLSTSFMDKSTGVERLRARLAKVLYFDDPRVELSSELNAQQPSDASRNQSPLALDINGQLSANWRLSAEIFYDTDSNRVERSSLGLRFNDRQNNIFNFTYRQQRQSSNLSASHVDSGEIKQGDISFYRSFGGNYNWVGRWNHDFTHHRELELFAGLEYNSCCWRASLVVRRWLDRDDTMQFPERDLQPKNGVFLQIQFKGLAGTGGHVDSILERGIQGYEPPQKF